MTSSNLSMVRPYQSLINSLYSELNILFRTRWVRSPRLSECWFGITHNILPDPNFSALPTYPVVLSFKCADTDVNLFSERIKGPAIPGMPRIDPNRIVRSSPFPS